MSLLETSWRALGGLDADFQTRAKTLRYRQRRWICLEAVCTVRKRLQRWCLRTLMALPLASQ